MKKNLSEFEYIKKVVMPDYRSVDIDNSLDWAIAENLLISNNKI
jgi:CMP-N-acetylneuraminic acid synthetase